MIRKMFWAGLLVAGLSFLAYRTSFGSHVSTAWSKVRACADKQLPTEWEIERVKQEVAQLIPDMKKDLSAIADEMVAVENLGEDIGQTEVNLKRQKDNIMAMRKTLESGVAVVELNGFKRESSRVRDQLDRDFRSYQRCEDGLKSKRKLLAAKEDSLAAARDRLATIRSKKEALEVQIAQLEADLKYMRLAQAKTNYQLDDSRLSRINATLSGIRDRLKSEKIVTDLQGEFGVELGTTEKKVQTGELLREIDGYFGETPKTTVVDKK